MEYFNVKFGDPSCIGNRAVNRQTKNTDKNRTLARLPSAWIKIQNVMGNIAWLATPITIFI